MSSEEKQKLHQRHTLASKKAYSKDKSNPKQTIRQSKRENAEGHEQD